MNAIQPRPRTLVAPQTRRARIALAVTSAVLVLAYVGPFFAPMDPTRTVGIPYSATGVLGTDFIGRDVLSRLLCGGTGVITAALAATAIAYAIGGFIGLLAGFVRRLDSPMMRIVDVLLSFPPVLFLLVVAAGAGRGLVVLSLAIAVTNMPAIARIIRSAVVEHRQRAYVEAAILRGETTSFILVRELLPNIIRILLADLGLRFTWSMLLVASVSFLGLGSQPPAPNWALMISENRPGMELQPWAVAAPAILIALLTVSVNVVADAFASRLGSSVTDVVR